MIRRSENITRVTIRETGTMMRKLIALVVIVFVMVVCGWSGAFAADRELICSSVTSTENSGLFSYILPMFEEKTGIKVKVVARGTGAAIEMGKRGDADVAFVHAKEQELKVAEEGFFVEWHGVRYNDFVIIGPGQ
jgi:tungstate transport system substrate-binding protein